MKRINLVIFNESYWDKGLIYTQNILPLIKLSQSTGYRIRLISFSSLPMLLLKRKEIKQTKKELLKEGIEITNFPMLFYPTRYMILKSFLIPLFFINIFLYIKYLAFKDEKHDNVIYSIRSYQAALGFYKFYPNKSRIVFDLRTDWIEENINMGVFKKNSYTVKYWKNIEEGMLKSFSKSLFISPIFMKNVLSRHGIENNPDKYIVLYNPIDYSHFNIERNDKNICNFLYTGSLGHWNSIDNYLDFFMSISDFFPSSNLIICTNSPKHKVEPIIKMEKYKSINNKIQIYYNVDYNELPNYYSRCKYGLQIMNKPDSRVGVKFIEYVAAGLIPIVHKNVQGAAQLVEKYNLGITFDDKDYVNPTSLAHEIKNKKFINLDSSEYKLFREETDLNQIFKKMNKIYG